jgi:nitrite reductase/ring-hydroxylating ferredoxin subunit
MSTNKGFWLLASGYRLCLLLTAYCLLFLASCKPDLSDDFIPQIPFPDIVINLNLPQYTTLKSDGGSVSIDGGVRGIIIYRKSSNAYLAYERNCSFQPNEACATVEVHSSNLFLIDTCCGSSFGLDDGNPTGGAAWRPLRRYKTYLNGSELSISSESANGM